jgi:hypothetical protein
LSTTPSSPSTRYQDTYWATLPVRELIPEIFNRVGEYVTYTQDVGLIDRWRRSWLHYYGIGTATSASSNKLSAIGDNGEYTSLKVNDYRSLVNHAVVIATQGRPTLQCRAANNDVESKRQCGLGNSLIEFYLREKDAEKLLQDSARIAFLFDEAHMVSGWNANVGEVVQTDMTAVPPGEEDNAPVRREGEPDHRIFGPWDVIRDVRLRRSKNSWHIFRVQLNRWDLIAQYPAFAEDLKSVPAQTEFIPTSFNFATPIANDNTDLIDGWLFLHDRTPALPDGRMTLIVGEVALNDTLSEGGGLPFESYPVSRLCPGEQYESTFGYTDANDQIAIQELRDAIVTIIASNEITFGGQNIAVKKGWGGSRSQLGGGMNLFELENPQTDIQPLQLAKTAPELFTFNQYLDKKQGDLIGVNQMVRGNPEENIKSGSFAALVDSKAMQFLSVFQASYNSFLEAFGNNLIGILQTYADDKRLVQIAGKSYESVLRSFKFDKSDLDKIVRVQCEQVNPLSQTLSGKQAIAQDLLNSGLIRDAQQYLEVLQTGRLEPMIGQQTNALYLMDAENEALADGKPVKALITDRHKEHIAKHMEPLLDPEVRMNQPELVQTTLAHVMEHLQLLQQTAALNPLLLWATNQEMPPLAPGPVGPGAPMPGGPPPNGAMPPAHPGGPPTPPQISNPQPPAQQEANGVRPPQMPKIAGTNQRAPGAPTSGGQPS